MNMILLDLYLGMVTITEVLFLTINMLPGIHSLGIFSQCQTHFSRSTLYVDRYHKYVKRSKEHHIHLQH